MTERNQIQLNKKRGGVNQDSTKKDENFAGQANKRKALKKPTASEQRSI